MRMYLLKIPFLVLIGGILWPNNAMSSEIDLAAGAPVALEHWQTMLGDWSTTAESLSQDGAGWKSTNNADWHFYLAMDGWAIRDEYFSPPLSEQLSDPDKRSIGTNLRIYDQDKQQWLMVWMTKSGKSVDVYAAKSDSEQIVMLAKQKNPQGYFSRITFFDMQQDSFEWKMEWSADGDKNWLEVHRIHGSRKNSQD